jgi:two-component system phosphate regulon sensor histidine kinase PhoR
VTPVRAASSPLDGAGDSGGVVLVLRDTTREREVERMKTEFLSNVSHELRTPLTPIRGYADLLSTRPGLAPEQVAVFAGTILAESLKMNRVVDLLVDVAALEAGRVEIRPRPVDVRQLVEARVVDWRQRAPHRADDLRRRVSTGLPAVLVDPTWLAKVLDELIDNAVKHTPDGAGITLAASPGPQGGVRLSVRDAGPGIAAEEQELLFTSFEQRDGSATRRVGGLGLGLAFVRRVAEDAGWSLTVLSPTGKGRRVRARRPGVRRARTCGAAARAEVVTPPAWPAAPRRAPGRGRGR